MIELEEVKYIVKENAKHVKIGFVRSEDMTETVTAV